MSNRATSDHQHASNTSVSELLKGQHDDAEHVPEGQYMLWGGGH